MSDDFLIHDETVEYPDLDWEEIMRHVIIKMVEIDVLCRNPGPLDSEAVQRHLDEVKLYCGSILSILS